MARYGGWIIGGLTVLIIQLFGDLQDFSSSAVPYYLLNIKVWKFIRNIYRA